MKGIVTPAELQKTIAARYSNGESTCALAKEYGLSPETCMRSVKRQGIKVRTSADSRRLSPLQEQEIIKEYLAGGNHTDISKKYGRSGNTTYLILKRNQIKPIYYWQRNEGRKYDFNQQYFDCIDSEEKAYWLGFMIADGNVEEEDGLSVTLARIDESHIVKFKNSIGSTAPITQYIAYLDGVPYPQSKLVVYSKDFVKRIVKYGLVRTKSLIVKPCDYTLSPSLISHYWRGVLDGDGGITKDGSEYRFYLTGNYLMLEGFKRFVSQYLPNNPSILRQGLQNSYQITYGGKEAPRRLADILYREAHVFLDRKYRLAAELFS